MKTWLIDLKTVNEVEFILIILENNFPLNYVIND